MKCLGKALRRHRRTAEADSASLKTGTFRTALEGLIPCFVERYTTFSMWNTEFNVGTPNQRLMLVSCGEDRSNTKRCLLWFQFLILEDTFDEISGTYMTAGINGPQSSEFKKNKRFGL